MMLHADLNGQRPGSRYLSVPQILRPVAFARAEVGVEPKKTNRATCYSGEFIP